ncbi:hypothetical protein ACLOJK_039088 [Asimina triloba]
MRADHPSGPPFCHARDHAFDRSHASARSNASQLSSLACPKWSHCCPPTRLQPPSPAACLQLPSLTTHSLAVGDEEGMNDDVVAAAAGDRIMSAGMGCKNRRMSMPPLGSGRDVGLCWERRRRMSRGKIQSALHAAVSLGGEGSRRI